MISLSGTSQRDSSVDGAQRPPEHKGGATREDSYDQLAAGTRGPHRPGPKDRSGPGLRT